MASPPDPAGSAPDEWLLPFTSPDPTAPDGDGRPWADGTAMAARAWHGEQPWDDHCRVTPMIGGEATFSAVRATFEAAIAAAASQESAGVPPGGRGQVYIAGWLFNALRDLSARSGPWDPAATVERDQTALGFVVRLMSAGVNVRLMLWMPTTIQRRMCRQHADEHWSVAAAVQDHERALEALWPGSGPLGVVSLDLRTAAPIAASIHQKAIVVRVGDVDVAFCGGIDLAFARRDYGRAGGAVAGAGDWQSGTTSPPPAGGWPRMEPPPAGGYPPFPAIDAGRFPEDLAEDVYGSGPRHWHDHHLKLEGPIVRTLEEQFVERWVMDTGSRVNVFERGATVIGRDHQVLLTSAASIAGGRVAPLPAPRPVAEVGEARVQMWRTIPLRAERRLPPFVRGEFTVLAGVANAVGRARRLVTVWDQFFWSEPFAAQLAHRLQSEPELRLIVVLPPHGTTDPPNELRLRRIAMERLWRGLSPVARERVLAVDLWAPEHDVGVYVHAKVQTYDDELLVCGSANMNRRSFECDMELDCAVRHAPTVRAHLANLFRCVTGAVWTDFDDGWLARYWDAVAAGHPALIPDPFFTAYVGHPKTPNGVPVPHDGRKPAAFFEPTSIGPDLYRTVAEGRDPAGAGRLDEVAFLLERCHRDGTWPYRKPPSTVVAVVGRHREGGEGAGAGR